MPVPGGRVGSLLLCIPASLQFVENNKFFTLLALRSAWNVGIMQGRNEAPGGAAGEVRDNPITPLKEVWEIANARSSVEPVVLCGC